MPNRRMHEKFDEYLTDHGVTFDGNFDIVHDRMDRDANLFGSLYHRDFDPHHTVDGVKGWMRKWCHLARQDTLTDYLRVALGHLVLDDIASKREFSNDRELLESAYRSYAQKGFGRRFFKGC